MKKKSKKPSTDAEVAAYWESHDATDVLPLAREHRVEAIYEPPVQSISIRLPVPLLNQIKRISARMDVAYQALIKIWLSEKIREQHRLQAQE